MPLDERVGRLHVRVALVRRRHLGEFAPEQVLLAGTTGIRLLAERATGEGYFRPI